MKIISYNIHKSYNTFKTKFILQEIKEYLNIHNPDIILIQELQETYDQKKSFLVESQLEYIADTTWTHYSYGKNAVYPNGHHGNAILSKYPIINWRNKDLSTNRFEQRGLLSAEINTPTGNITVFNTHLNLLQTGRNVQSEWIISEIEKCQTPWVLMGDFNDWNYKLIQIFEEKLKVKECFRQEHIHTPATFPCFNPVLSLDRAFIKDLKLVEARLLFDEKSKKLSDHLPIQITISL